MAPDWVHLVRRWLIGLLYLPRVRDGYGAFGGMKTVRENRSTRRKPAPVLLCPPQIPYDLTWGSNPGRGGEQPATNRLSYGTAVRVIRYAVMQHNRLVAAKKCWDCWLLFSCGSWVNLHHITILLDTPKFSVVLLQYLGISNVTDRNTGEARLWSVIGGRGWM
jgi:hypothetical protein